MKRLPPHQLLLPLLLLQQLSYSLVHGQSCTATPSNGVLDFSLSSAEGAQELNDCFSLYPDTEFVVTVSGHVTLTNPLQPAEGVRLSLRGDGQGPSILDAEGTSRIITMQFPDTSLTVTGVTLQNGWAEASGGCISSVSTSQHIVLDGDTVVQKCTAAAVNGGGGVGGGVFTQGNLTVKGNAQLLNNSAGYSGGGVWMENFQGLSYLTVGDNANIAYNAAPRGAGVAAFNAVVVLEGNAKVTRNEAFQPIFGEGGAVYMCFALRDDAFCSLMVRDNAEVSYNAATVTGGAFNGGGSGGSVVVQDNAVVVGNHAEDGGAFQIHGGATVDLSGSARVAENTASRRGGAARLEAGGTLTIGGSVEVVGNVAREGGAFSGEIGNIYIRDDAKITGNIATNRGGAAHLDDETFLLVADRADVSNNSAANDGGAVFCAYSTLVLSGESKLAFNSGGRSGGAVKVGPGCSMTVQDQPRLEFNTATNGAALHLDNEGRLDDRNHNNNSSSSSSSDGVTFEGNAAASRGGALYITDQASAVLNANAVRFVNNSATLSGGAVFQLNGTSFSPTFSCPFCYFTGSSASCCSAVRGVVRPPLSLCIDVDNAFAGVDCCRTSQFISWVEGGESSEAFCDVIDSETMVDENRVGVLLTDLRVADGYWRDSVFSVDIKECWNEDACSPPDQQVVVVTGGGGAAVGDTAAMMMSQASTTATGQSSSLAQEYCTEGFEGPYCAVCESGYASETGYECQECTSGYERRVQGGLGVFLIAVVCVAALLSLWLIGFVGEGQGGEGQGEGIPSGLLTRFGAVLWSVPWRKFRTVLITWQILTQYAQVTAISFPGSVLNNFLFDMDLVVNFDFGLLLSRGCLGRITFYDRMLAATLGPLLIGAALLCTLSVARSRKRLSAVVAAQRHSLVLCVLGFLVYSPVSTTLFRTFACEELEGGRYLRADYSLECDTAQHIAYMAYAGFMIALYTIGIPVMFGYVTNSARVKGRESAVWSAGRALRRRYRAPCFFWEVVECVRRLALGGGLVFINPGTTVQPAIGCIFSCVCIVAYFGFRPFRATGDLYSFVLGSTVIFMVMYLSLLVRLDVSNEDKFDQETFATLVVALNILLVLDALIQCAAAFVAQHDGRAATQISQPVPTPSNVRKAREIREGLGMDMKFSEFSPFPTWEDRMSTDLKPSTPEAVAAVMSQSSIKRQASRSLSPLHDAAKAGAGAKRREESKY